MDWRYAEQCRLRDTPARRGQGKDPGLETVVGEYKAGSRTNLKILEFGTELLQLKRQLGAS